ncbi:heme-thiolate peroxidase, partial [Candolleomyces efflorescens]
MFSSKHFLALISSILSIFCHLTFGFPSFEGLSERDLKDDHLASRQAVGADPPPPPGPLDFSGSKLVNDPSHAWVSPRTGDIRGPCPALNTLANHGYLPRDGIVTPTQLINGVQEGLNLENSIAVFVTYAAMLTDGNLLTNKLSIGRKSSRTGPDPPPPATAGGLSTPGLGPEGDASLTRVDDALGDNSDLNQDLFNQFIDFCNRYGGGYYNLTVAAELRWARIQQSISTNPTFSFVAPRYFTAYAESALIINAFVDGRNTSRHLSTADATAFFKNNRFPLGFFRASQPVGNDGAAQIFGAHPIPPGSNVNGVNTYTADANSANLAQFCVMYENFVNRTVRSLYPEPTGALRRNLILNLKYFFSGQPSKAGCMEIPPYGQL